MKKPGGHSLIQVIGGFDTKSSAAAKIATLSGEEISFPTPKGGHVISILRS